MAEPLIAKKIFDLSLTALGKSTSVVVKGLAVILLVAGFFWAIYCAYIKPNINPIKTTTQNADNMTNINHNYPKAGFGCMRIQVYERKDEVK
jgi:hypothetical protein